MSVTLQPSKSLGFHRPLTQNVKCFLYITNPNADPVFIKVKTTAPKLYGMQPISGKVGPGKTIEIQVTLRSMKEEPPLNAKCEDKFVIQSMLIPPKKAAIPLRDLSTTPWSEEIGKVYSQKDFPHWITVQPSNSLGFNRPLTQDVKCPLNITNHEANPISFKVRMTAPELYNVQPNPGKIDPGQTVEIQVILLAMKEEPPLSAKCTDEFFIRSMLIPSEKAITPLHELWSVPWSEETGWFQVYSQKVKDSMIYARN